MLYIEEEDHQMLDPQVDWGGAARLRGEGPEEERMILKDQGGDILADRQQERGCLQELYG